MDTVISMISDLIILIFDLALYIHMTRLKKEDALHRGLMYGGSAVITAAYVVCVYILKMPYAISSFCCGTVPSFLLFLWLSRYKSARFLVTFCFVDTVTLIVAAFGKLALILGGTFGGLLSCIVMLVLTIGTYILLRPYFPKYRGLMDRVSKGWVPMAVSTVFIYLLLVVSAAYPKPLAARMEYVPVYVLLCVTILSFYAVFIVLIQQKAKLSQANLLLQQQQHWHDLAYLDELTQLANTSAYVARTAELEGIDSRDSDCSLVIFDIDNFKRVNDTHGHLYGNTVLKKTAKYFLSNFPGDHYEFFRIGGDEFAAIVQGIPRDQLEEQIHSINAMPFSQDLGCTYSCGYAPVDFSQENAFHKAFKLADQAMYAVKESKKQKGK